MNIKKNILIYFSIALVGSAIIISFLLKSDLKNNRNLIIVVPVSMNARYKSQAVDYTCAIQIADQPVIKVPSMPVKIYRQNVRRLLIGKYLPAIYSKKFNMVELLLLPEDFSKHGLPYPDSLRWIDSLNSRY